ncbi:MAG: response regulator transcription factor [Pseudomonadota bacterium]
MHRVVVVEDQALVRAGIKSLLALSDQVDVVGEGSDGDEVASLAETLSPDVFLIDIRMPRVDGIEAIRRLRASGDDTPVIILTTFDDHRLVLDGIEAGAQGYLLKDVSLEVLIEAIDSVCQGKTMLRPAITETVIDSLARRTTPFEASEVPEPLSPRELEVLRLMAGGYSNKEISSALSKSEGTIKNQVSAVLAKLGVRDRTRAVLKAIEMGWL